MSEVILLHEGFFFGGEAPAAPFCPDESGNIGVPGDFTLGHVRIQVPDRAPVRGGRLPCLRRPMPALPGWVYVCGLCSSSLDAAHALAGMGLLPVWSSVLAIGQTAGRGQLGRNWHSGDGNLFAALRLPPQAPFAGPEAAPAFGSLLAAGLRDSGFHVLLKWPNDIVAPDPQGKLRKAGGILLEERHGRLMAGIGLNLAGAPPPDALREGHALPGGILYRTDLSPPPSPDPLSIWLELVVRMKVGYTCASQTDDRANSGFAGSWLALAESLLAWLGQEAAITEGPNDTVRLRGIVAGLTPDGGLCLRTGESMHVAHSGSLIQP